MSNKFSRLLTKYIKTVHVPIKKSRQLLKTAIDHLGLKIPVVYRIPCECGKVYIGQTGRSIETKYKEHIRHIRLDQPEKSAVAEHSINAVHKIDFNNVSVLERASGFMDRLVKEAIQIRLNQNNNNNNRGNGFTLSRACNPVTKLLLTHNLDPGKAAIEPPHRPSLKPLFLNRRAAARYRALGSILPGRERFSWNLSFYFSKHFS
jgi:hypothetical protein